MKKRLRQPDPVLAELGIIYSCFAWTGYYKCQLLEWSGFYNSGIQERLIGHYRLFQHYRVNYTRWRKADGVIPSYIFHYRSTHAPKYMLARMGNILCSICSPKSLTLIAAIASVNRQLVNESSDILQEFLTMAETDLVAAVIRAKARIEAPSFIIIRAGSPPPPSPTLVQINHENNYEITNFQYNTNFHSEINFQPVLMEGPKGKPMGVFSKRQDLILLDLLSESVRLERIDLSRPNKFDAIADFLHALTGKSKASFIEELHTYKNKSLYEFHTPGERRQLIGMLRNLAELLRKAGFRSVASAADRKIRQLESTLKD